MLNQVAAGSHKTNPTDNILNKDIVESGEVLRVKKDKPPKQGMTCESVFKGETLNKDELNRLWADIINILANSTACIEKSPVLCYNNDMQSHAHRKDEVSGE